ncbi:MAG TPA: restriction endonuclease subunit S [Candidatus Adamsella sp.]|nr:restriction endonuclease subunit S [Candidatus Adamsella sp.]
MFENIPKNWEKVALENLLEYEQPTNYIVASEEYNDSYPIPVLTAGKSFILGYTNETEGIYQNTPVIIFDDFTTESKFVDFEFKVKSSAMKILKAKDNDTLKYLYYLMQILPFNNTQHKRYWISEYSKIKIGIPKDINEVKEIVKVLDAASEIIRLRTACIESAQSLIPALFQEMFGDMSKNTNSYELFKIKNLGKVTTGSTPSSKKENMFGGDIPFITPADLESGQDKYGRYVTQEGAKNSRIVRAGSTLVCCIGATIGKVDKAIVDSCFNQQINAIEWDESINDIFGLYLFRQIAPLIRNKASHTTLPILNKGNFENIIIPKPPKPKQDLFAEKAQEIEEYIKSQQAELENAKAMFHSLLHHAFTGELTRRAYGE